MPVIEENETYLKHVPLPLFLCMQEEGKSQVLQLAGEMFLFKPKVPMLIPMQKKERNFMKDLIRLNGGSEDGPIRIYKKDINAYISYEEQMRIINAARKKKPTVDVRKKKGPIARLKDKVSGKKPNGGK